MKSLATLEAGLWLAERHHRRNPSEESEARIAEIQAEIDNFGTEATTAKPVKKETAAIKKAAIPKKAATPKKKAD